MTDVLNHITGNCLWYHTTPRDRLESILRHGLLPGSTTTCHSVPEPWIYLSTLPWLGGDTPQDVLRENVVLEVDLAGYGTENVGWAFVDGPGSESWEKRWQLRAFKPIAPGRLRVLTDQEIRFLSDTRSCARAHSVAGTPKNARRPTGH